MAALALTALPAMSANAAIVPTVGSAHPLYLLSDETGLQFPAGTSLPWDASVLASPDASDEDWNSAFVAPAGSTQVRTFIAPRGQETNLSAWNAYASLGNQPSVSGANLSPFGNTSTGAGTPSGAGAVGIAGGDYSLGLAFLDVAQNTILEVDYTYITVVGNANPNLATWTFATPAAPAAAPVVTTTSLNGLTKGSSFSQTIAATGTAPIAWSVQAGALPAGLALDAATGAIAGTPTAAGAYSFTLRATNAAGFDDQAFSGTVEANVPAQPTDADAGKVTIADPAEGATTVTVAAGAAHASQTLQAWGWSDPTNLGQVTTDAAGNATVDISGLPAGATHTIALTLPGSLAVVAWGTIDIPAPAYGAKTDDVDITATVTASDLWALNAENTQVDFGNVQRDVAKTASLGKVTVIDDRNVLKGWNLDAAWTDFAKAGSSDTIAKSALSIAPKVFTGYTPLAGITVNTGGHLAESQAVSTLPTGALFDADLTFKAPVTAQTGEYHSTLTLTLTSK
ncbi:Ig domain-containing protein [Agromyces sp. MMS24-JH15]|uniref:Ig domain-containing protein n=1 Tax=Agromyces sp. MMS24-JH15 TaxID=3243765 RepID=UPI003748960F